MNWTKKDLECSCILCKSLKHGERIIKFYKDNGFNVGTFKGSCIGWYYGIAQMDCMRVSRDFKESYFTKIIELPTIPRRKFPREMMVSYDKRTWDAKMVFGKIKNDSGEYLTRDPFHPQGNHFMGWKYAKEIE